MVSESEAVLEEELLKKLESEGYERVNISGEKELRENFKIQLEKFNNCSLSDEEFDKVMNHLERGSLFEKAKKLRTTFQIERDEGTLFLSFLNKNEWCKNVFQVFNQITMKKIHTNRYDVTILINGLPLVQIELKKRGMPLKNAFEQVKRYKKHSFKGLFDYLQIFVISNGVGTKYFANTNKDIDFAFTFFWKDEENNNIKSIDEFAETFLERCNLAKMISRYMVLHETSKTLMVLRAYQKYAIEAILKQALEVKQNGYIWHTTGSGKTLTSFKASKLLAEEESIDKVIFVVDRKDLDIQTTREFQAFCPDCIDYTYNTNALVKNLLSEQKKMLVTTIQKLDRAIKNEESSKKLSVIKDKNIVFIYDECHRSQFGEMHKNIDGFFNNVLSFGFTGTPIFEKNRKGMFTTKSIFNKRLHSYSIKDGIRDQNVLGFSVEYYKLAHLKENATDKNVKNIDTEGYYKSEERMDLIVNHILDSYNTNTNDGEFNAIFAVSRGGIIHDYYRKFKEKDHNLNIATIFSVDDNAKVEPDEEHPIDLRESYIQDYNKMFGTNYSTESYSQYHADVSRRMINGEIDLLIVMDMFLTGFDSKLLNTLYVDKNLEYHNLLQAFSRTNRICNPRKSQGNIICYRNLEDNVNYAIELFSNGNPSEDVIIEPYECFVEKFNKALDEFFEIVKTVADAQALERESDKKKFVEKFSELIKIKNKLDYFSQFTFDNLNIEEQDFNNFKSIYLDIYDEFRGNEGNGPESILDSVIFEIELIRKDNINVDYILNLIENLDADTGGYEHNKERIINLMKQTEKLRSKIDLIEKFIDYKLPSIDNQMDIKYEFDKFMKNERNSAINELIQNENLEKDIACQIFEKYLFSNKLDDDLIEKSFKEKLGLISRTTKIDEVKDKIYALFERFDY